VSAVAAPPTRLPSRLQPLLDRVRGHEWVEAARIVAPAAEDATRAVDFLVVPSTAGVQMLRRSGKLQLLAVWRDLMPPGISSRVRWHLVEDLAHPRSADDVLHSRPIVDAVERDGADAVSCRLRVPYEMRVFDGHFVGVPLVPGMLQGAWALDIARDALPQAGGFVGIDAVKFRRLVRPGMALRLTLRWRVDTSELRFDYVDGPTTISLGRLRMAGGRG
jgi:hypothetical protein